ncbi:AbrB family transcriptional regulator [Candidatus Acidianus copahuensis]|uniref:AbrB family transcriptional regulator n=1 Tax=Candidatus Acidianus copahuensis TaxID=1160895 RepID=A0A031LNW3_9CREN|nr:AbrB/MazE/SpoVT family DNA-binding domain-containing protein [Candidatus Acidianus copahuensis]EZQ06696.1 AbrB family transcriptional regulator [Candidatus Acidianus copahuensis]
MKNVYRLKVYKKGIIVIPKEVRDLLQISEDGEVELVIEGKEVKLRRPNLTLGDLFGIDKDIDWEKELEELRRKEVENEERYIS